MERGREKETIVKEKEEKKNLNYERAVKEIKLTLEELENMKTIGDKPLKIRYYIEENNTSTDNNRLLGSNIPPFGWINKPSMNIPYSDGILYPNQTLYLAIQDRLDRLIDDQTLKHNMDLIVKIRMLSEIEQLVKMLEDRRKGLETIVQMQQKELENLNNKLLEIFNINEKLLSELNNK